MPCKPIVEGGYELRLTITANEDPVLLDPLLNKLAALPSDGIISGVNRIDRGFRATCRSKSDAVALFEWIEKTEEWQALLVHGKPRAAVAEIAGKQVREPFDPADRAWRRYGKWRKEAVKRLAVFDIGVLAKDLLKAGEGI